jgi:hypothetical protein
VVKFGVEEVLFLVTERRTERWTYVSGHYETGVDLVEASDRMLAEYYLAIDH